MEISFGEKQLLMQEHEVNGYKINIILLTDTVQAYLLEINDEYSLYITDTKDYAGQVDFIKSFKSKIDALKFAHEKWSTVVQIEDYKKKFEYIKNRKATKKQIESTYGQATTMAEATWFFAKRTCYFRMKDVIEEKLGKEVKKTKTVKEELYEKAIKE